MRGKAIPLSAGRRFVADLVAASAWTTKGVIIRRMNLAPLLAARAGQGERTPFTALLACGWARVADGMPELRRSWTAVPRAGLHEVPVSIAAIVVERDLDGEPTLQFARIRAPDRLGPIETGRELKRLATTPLADIPDTAKLLRITRWPWPIRRLLWWIGLNVGRQRPNFFGTFGITSLAGEGARIGYAVHPLTSCLSPGPIAQDGSLEIKCSFDHRVFDGVLVARALERLEAELNGPVALALRADEAGPAPRT